MTLHWPAQLALLLYLILLALIAFNLAVVLELPLWSAALPPVLAVVAVAATWLIAGRRRALFVCLTALGSLGLLAVAAVLAAPAWQVIADGASRSWAGRMLPMFAAALALHACNLWVSTAAAGESDERVERLARLIYGPGIFTSLITALILCASLILGMEWLARGAPAGLDAHALTRRFLERGIIPPLTVLLFFWGLLLLLGKWWNDWYLRRALARWSAGLTLLRPSPFTAGFDALTANAAGLDEGLQLLWRRHEESWLLPRYLSWAVPVLGFIGTVLGISLAAEGIRRIIASDAGLASLSSDLDGAIAPLGIAFDTTLIALSLSVVLTLALALVQRGEERLLATLERQARAAAREA